MTSSTLDLNREVFPADTNVFCIGDAGDAAYVIESGCVEVLVGPEGAQHRVDVMTEGGIFGEVALLDRQPRTATVRTLTPTTLVRIDRPHVEGLLSHADPVIQYLVRLLLERYRRSRIVLPPNLAQTPANQQGAQTNTMQATAVRTLLLAHDLSDALDFNQLALYYQPLVNLQSGGCIGYEALMRWRHPSLGLICPNEFIGLAEKTGIIHRIGQWGLLRAAQDWKQLCGLHAPDTPPVISVNLSAPEMCRPDIVDQIQDCTQAHGMPMSALCIELTETTLANNLQAVTSSVARLRQCGASVALDDFGTGYASLDYLQNMAFSNIKIDRSFVQQMSDSVRSASIVQSALDLSHRLGIGCVAEGVEDSATAQALIDMGYQICQGYHYAHPMALADVLAGVKHPPT